MSNEIEDLFKDPEDNEQYAEEILKRMDALQDEQQKKANDSFKEAIKGKTWRTKYGKFIQINEMDDNHLLNSFKMIRNNLETAARKAGVPEDQIDKELESVDNALEVNLSSQEKAYRFLKEEIDRRGLFQKKLEQSFNDTIDVFNQIISNRQDDDETQQS